MFRYVCPLLLFCLGVTFTNSAQADHCAVALPAAVVYGQGVAVLGVPVACPTVTYVQPAATAYSYAQPAATVTATNTVVAPVPPPVVYAAQPVVTFAVPFVQHHGHHHFGARVLRVQGQGHHHHGRGVRGNGRHRR